MDVLRNQIDQRKTIDLVTSQAKFEDMPFEFPKPDAEAIDHAAVVLLPARMKFQPHHFHMKIHLHSF